MRLCKNVQLVRPKSQPIDSDHCHFLNLPIMGSILHLKSCGYFCVILYCNNYCNSLVGSWAHQDLCMKLPSLDMSIMSDAQRSFLEEPCYAGGCCCFAHIPRARSLQSLLTVTIQRWICFINWHKPANDMPTFNEKTGGKTSNNGGSC